MSLVRRASWIGLALLIGLQAVQLVVWIARDDRPPGWDSAWHAMLSLYRYRQLFEDPASSRAALETYPLLAYAAAVYPPFVHLVALPLYLAFGTDYDVALASGVLFVVVLVLASHRIGASACGTSGGIVLACVISTIPQYGAMMREYLLDFPLAAVTAAALAALAADPSSTRLRALATGSILGLGMLTKWSFAIFVAVPLSLALASRGTGDRNEDRSRNKLLLVLTALAVALTWYDPHRIQSAMPVLVQNLTSQGPMEGDPPPLTSEGLLYYAAVCWLGYSPLYATATLVGIASLVLNRAPTRQWLPWLASAAFAYVAFALMPNKEPRYIAPLYVPLATLLVMGVFAIPRRRVRNAAIAVIVVAGLVQNVLYDAAIGGRIRAGPIVVAALDGKPPARPIRIADRMLARIRDRSAGSAFSLCVASEDPHVNDVGVSYAAFARQERVVRLGQGGCEPLDYDYTLVGPVVSTWRAESFLHTQRRLEADGARFERLYVEGPYVLFARRDRSATSRPSRSRPSVATAADSGSAPPRAHEHLP